MKCLFTVIFLFWVTLAYGAVTIDTSDSAYAAGFSSLTISLTTSGTNSGLVVGCAISTGGGSNFTGVTWNTSENFAVNGITTASPYIKGGIFTLSGASVGSYDVVISADNALPIICGVIALNGVSTFGTENDNASTTTGAPSVSVSSGAGLIIDVVIYVDSGFVPVATGDNTGNEILILEDPTGGQAKVLVMSSAIGGGTKTMSWDEQYEPYTALAIPANEVAPPATARRRGVIVR